MAGRFGSGLVDSPAGSSLSRRERPQTEIEAEARAAGISKRTLNRAASSDLVGRRQTLRQWFWRLL
jgi:hypothetical protein